jgi:hypothetical protein
MSYISLNHIPPHHPCSLSLSLSLTRSGGQRWRWTLPGGQRQRQSELEWAAVEAKVEWAREARGGARASTSVCGRGSEIGQPLALSLSLSLTHTHTGGRRQRSELGRSWWRWRAQVIDGGGRGRARRLRGSTGVLCEITGCRARSPSPSSSGTVQHAPSPPPQAVVLVPHLRLMLPRRLAAADVAEQQEPHWTV